MYAAVADDRLHALEAMLPDVLCTVRRAGYYELDSSWTLPRRMTPHHVLFYIVSGRVGFSVSGEQYELSGGDVILTPPQLVQSGDAAITADDRLRLYVLHFSARLHGHLDAPQLLGLPATFALAVEDRREMTAGCRRIVTELERNRPGAWLAANGDCARIVALLWRQSILRPEKATSRADVTLSALVRLKPVFDAIETHYAESLRIGDLSALVHLHPVYFAALFRRGTGLAPSQYLADFRLGKARELLATTQLSQNEIARRTGHGTASYLSRVFRRVEGLPPGEYRVAVQLGSRSHLGP